VRYSRQLRLQRLIGFRAGTKKGARVSIEITANRLASIGYAWVVAGRPAYGIILSCLDVVLGGRRRCFCAAAAAARLRCVIDAAF